MKINSIQAVLAALLVTIIAVACESAPKALPPESRLVVAVAGIENAPASAKSWDETLVSGLLKTLRFRVIERAKLDALLAENELSLSSLGDATAAPKMLSVTGADAILFAKVTDIREYSGRWDDAVTGWWGDVSLGIEAKVAARLVSVANGEVLAATEVSGKAEAGNFSGAMGPSVVDKSREDLTSEAIAASLEVLAQKIARDAPMKK